MRSCTANVVSKDLRDGLGKWGRRPGPCEGYYTKTDSEAEVTATGICGSDNCQNIPEVSGTESCPEVTVNSEPVGLTSITMEQAAGEGSGIQCRN